jgi:hypothetical protein
VAPDTFGRAALCCNGEDRTGAGRYFAGVHEQGFALPIPEKVALACPRGLEHSDAARTIHLPARAVIVGCEPDKRASVD